MEILLFCSRPAISLVKLRGSASSTRGRSRRRSSTTCSSARRTRASRSRLPGHGGDGGARPRRRADAATTGRRRRTTARASTIVGAPMGASSSSTTSSLPESRARVGGDHRRAGRDGRRLLSSRSTARIVHGLFGDPAGAAGPRRARRVHRDARAAHLLHEGPQPQATDASSTRAPVWRRRVRAAMRAQFSSISPAQLRRASRPTRRGWSR